MGIEIMFGYDLKSSIYHDWRDIVINTETKRHSIRSGESTSDYMEGSVKAVDIIFDNPSIVENAVKTLQNQGAVHVSGLGLVEIRDETWNHTYNVGGDDYDCSQTVHGIISCDLTVLDGVLQPFTYSVTSAPQDSDQGRNSPILHPAAYLDTSPSRRPTLTGRIILGFLATASRFYRKIKSVLQAIKSE